MKLIVGLGNPGAAYARNRHNVGFQLVEGLAKAHGLVFSRQQFRARVAAGRIAGHDVILAKPLTFMNLSGNAVGSLAHFFKLASADLIVAYDDLDLPLGRVRLRAGGGSGGHKGMKSIIERVGTDQFARLRIGIGRPTAGDPVDYVLENFSKDDSITMAETLEHGRQAILVWLDEGIDATMNQFNRVADGD